MASRFRVASEATGGFVDLRRGRRSLLGNETIIPIAVSQPFNRLFSPWHTGVFDTAEQEMIARVVEAARTGPDGYFAVITENGTGHEVVRVELARRGCIVSGYGQPAVFAYRPDEAKAYLENVEAEHARRAAERLKAQRLHEHLAAKRAKKRAAKPLGDGTKKQVLGTLVDTATRVALRIQLPGYALRVFAVRVTHWRKLRWPEVVRSVECAAAHLATAHKMSAGRQVVVYPDELSTLCSPHSDKRFPMLDRVDRARRLKLIRDKLRKNRGRWPRVERLVRAIDQIERLVKVVGCP